jgi:hypothetical protein
VVSLYWWNTPSVSRNTDEFTFLFVTGLPLVKIGDLDMSFKMFCDQRLCVFVALECSGV